MARLSHIFFCCIVSILCQQLVAGPGAEDDFVLLTIDGDLIGLAEGLHGPLTNREEALRVAAGYHQLLTPDLQLKVEAVHEQLLKLIPDFEVAYAAADSAEITYVMSEIDIRLAAIHEIHVHQYKQEVLELLVEAYQLILPTFGDN